MTTGVHLLTRFGGSRLSRTSCRREYPGVHCTPPKLSTSSLPHPATDTRAAPAETGRRAWRHVTSCNKDKLRRQPVLDSLHLLLHRSWRCPACSGILTFCAATASLRQLEPLRPTPNYFVFSCPCVSLAAPPGGPAALPAAETVTTGRRRRRTTSHRTRAPSLCQAVTVALL
eukprot:757563-Hanusia_phi.AAC.5